MGGFSGPFETLKSSGYFYGNFSKEYNDFHNTIKKEINQEEFARDSYRQLVSVNSGNINNINMESYRRRNS